MSEGGIWGADPAGLSSGFGRKSAQGGEYSLLLPLWILYDQTKMYRARKYEILLDEVLSTRLGRYVVIFRKGISKL